MQALILSFGGLFVIVSTLLNTVVIYVFAKMNDKLQLKDLLIVSMASGDALQALLGYTTGMGAELLRENFETRVGGLRLCKASGFIVTFLALSSISHLTVMAYDRYLSVCKPFFASRLHDSTLLTNLVLFLTWLYAFAWSIFPFMSWSSYEPETDAKQCSINWSSKQLKDQIYIIFLFISCFFLPIIIMFYSFFCVRKEIRAMQGRAAQIYGNDSANARDTAKAERRYTRLALFMCAVFIAIWFPYSLLSFWAAFFDHYVRVPSFLATTAAVIAKSSTIINPIIYSFLHKGFRQCLMRSAIGKVICPRTAVHPTNSSTMDPGVRQ